MSQLIHRYVSNYQIFGRIFTFGVKLMNKIGATNSDELNFTCDRIPNFQWLKKTMKEEVIVAGGGGGVVEVQHIPGIIEVMPTSDIADEAVQEMNEYPLETKNIVGAETDVNIGQLNDGGVPMNEITEDINIFYEPEKAYGYEELKKEYFEVQLKGLSDLLTEMQQNPFPNTNYSSRVEIFS